MRGSRKFRQGVQAYFFLFHSSMYSPIEKQWGGGVHDSRPIPKLGGLYEYFQGNPIATYDFPGGGGPDPLSPPLAPST